ncbi:MAG: T9SS type A sorting domain-containing protein [Crocinitomicaceae bacterium]|nr:T9SS type A sorting domain-containing protein [Crocinitomicaceae bacterium]
MKTILASILILASFIGWAQDFQEKYKVTDESPAWIKYMYGDTVSLFSLREQFEDFYKVNPFEKNQHTQYFKRLMKEYWLDLDTDGFITERLNSAAPAQAKSPTSPWQEVGPWDYDHEQAMAFSVQSPGSAHVYTVEQSPVDSDLIYAGTATAGLWKSSDKGMNWTLVTRDLDVNSVYAIAMDPNSSSTVYFGESNGKLWKSTDGGINWSMTGDAGFQSMNMRVRDLKFIGINTLLAATSNGLYRSVDGGANWTEVHAGEHMEIEIKPNDPTILYTVKLVGDKTEFYKSEDTGLTWTLKPNGWPSPANGDEQKRCEISVSAANPNLVYVLASGDVGPDGGLYGIYKSTDAGESFSFECCDGSAGGAPTVTNPNILGWSEDGTGDGGQYYYDLALGASPTDADRLFGAGINVWRSLNGGSDWTLNGHWVTWAQGGSLKHRYSHADVHDIKFFDIGSSIDMWVASDGGLFYSATQGDSLEPRMHGIHGTDFWGFGAGFKDGYVMVGGTYHNGTLIRYKDIYKGGLANPSEGGWLAERGGDNYRGFVNYGDNKIGYDDGGSFEFSEVREIRKTGRSFQSDKKCNTSYVAGEYGTYGFESTCYNNFYSPVGTELYKTTNGGVSFEFVHDFGGDKVIQVKVAWNDPLTIYVTHKVGSGNYQVRKSNDGGATWGICTPPSSVTNNNSNRVKYIEVDDENPDKLWCILMGSQSGYKVFESVNGGSNWTNITGNALTGENVRSIVHHYGTDDGLYVGTTKRMYYRNASMSDWALFNNELPASVNCQFLQPYYGEGKIRMASQRGVYECEFYEDDAPPVAMFAADQVSLNLATNCIADTVQFVDHSTVRQASAAWEWYFEGGTPSTSTLENPQVIYTSPGTYDVRLIASDMYGVDTIEIADFMEITESYDYPTIAEDFNGTEFPPAGWKLFDSEGSSWEQDWPLDDPNNKVAGYPNYWVDATGEQHLLIMPAFDFTNLLNMDMTWDYTYNDNNGYTDSLAVVYRTGSNPNWQTLWIRGGVDLEVFGTQTWFWDASTPTINWGPGYLNLDFLAGESCVEIAFDNRGYYGNHVWVDNVNLLGTYDSSELDELEMSVNVFPNPSKGSFKVLSSELIVSYTVVDLTGRNVIENEEISTKHFSIDLSDERSGMYVLEITTNSGRSITRLIKE